MWLLDAKTKQLKQFMDDRLVVGKYAILSHTWKEGQEVAFHELDNLAAKSRSGYQKIEYACTQALRDGLAYAWVDTCCIDKRSSAELSEAINSMYRWYYNAHICYVYLSDARLPNNMIDSEHIAQILQDCKWIKRGWTLQELVAPKLMAFYDKEWSYMGDKVDNAERLSRVTAIDVRVLRDRDLLHRTSIAQRMSWASRRITTRLEDEAYSLLGLLEVTMPLLYGEGRRSFQRLQEEIIRTHSSEDHSILAWRSTSGELLAPSAASFGFASNMKSWSLPQGGKFELTNRGLRIAAFVRAGLQEDIVDVGDLTLALECSASGDSRTQQALILRRRPQIAHHTQVRMENLPPEDAIYDRQPGLVTVTLNEMQDFVRREITLARTRFQYPRNSHVRITHSTEFSIRHKRASRSSSTRCVPKGDWDAQLGMLYLRPAVPELSPKSYQSEYACIELYATGPAQLYLPLAVMLQTPIGRTDNFTPPRLHVQRFPTLGHLDDLHAAQTDSYWRTSHSIRLIETGDGRFVQIIVRYVMLAGDVMFNLHFSMSKTAVVEPAASECGASVR